MTTSLGAAIDSSRPRVRDSIARTKGRLVEFLAVGGATLVLFPVAWLARAAFGRGAAELAFGFLTFHAATVINDPHFAVTYLLFYDDARQRAFGAGHGPAQRARYVVAGLVVPAALSAWALSAILSGSARALGWLIQLMFLLVRWHYVKQGFGVFAVLSARRGVTYRAGERAVVLGHCLAAGAYAWARPLGAVTEVEEKGVVYTTLAAPLALRPITQAAFWASAVALAYVLVRKWRRDGRAPALAPLLGMLVTVWAWTVFSNVDPLMVYLIPALHSVQYLYFVWLLKRNEGRAALAERGFGPSVRARLALLGASAVGLGWLLLRGAPAFLDGSRGWRVARALPDLGPTPYFAAFFAVVNIHHYFMDHVIWRRDHAPTRYLRD